MKALIQRAYAGFTLYRIDTNAWDIPMSYIEDLAEAVGIEVKDRSWEEWEKMGEIADMMLEGLICEWCGELLDEPTGYPTVCPACLAENEDEEDER